MSFYSLEDCSWLAQGQGDKSLKYRERFGMKFVMKMNSAKEMPMGMVWSPQRDVFKLRAFRQCVCTLFMLRRRSHDGQARNNECIAEVPVEIWWKILSFAAVDWWSGCALTPPHDAS